MACLGVPDHNHINGLNHLDVLTYASSNGNMNLMPKLILEI